MLLYSLLSYVSLYLLLYSLLTGILSSTSVGLIVFLYVIGFGHTGVSGYEVFLKYFLLLTVPVSFPFVGKYSGNIL